MQPTKTALLLTLPAALAISSCGGGSGSTPSAPVVANDNANGVWEGQRYPIGQDGSNDFRAWSYNGELYGLEYYPVDVFIKLDYTMEGSDLIGSIATYDINHDFPYPRTSGAEEISATVTEGSNIRISGENADIDLLIVDTSINYNSELSFVGDWDAASLGHDSSVTGLFTIDEAGSISGNLDGCTLDGDLDIINLDELEQEALMATISFSLEGDECSTQLVSGIAFFDTGIYTGGDYVHVYATSESWAYPVRLLRADP